MTLRLAGEAEADQLLDSNSLALLIGMLLDQQYPMEAAFAGPKKLAGRIDSFDAGTIAAYNPDKFAELCAITPAVHRYPGSMAKRIQAVCAHIVAEYEGDAAAIWTQGEPTGEELLQRLKALPGFGDQKARIFVALLGKQRGVQPQGWRETAGAYGDDGSRRSIADVTDEQSLAEVRDFKKQAKAAAKK